MDEFLIRLVAGGLGFAVGLATGLVTRRWRLTRADLLMLVLALVVLAAAASTAHTNARVDHVASCTAAVTSDIVRAANERATANEQAIRRTGELWDAQRQLLEVLLAPDAPRPVRRQALADYRDALAEYRTAQSNAARQRRDHPWPTQAEIRRCKDT